MRRGDITNLLCLPCILFFFYVNSQNSCPPGWFGSECKYKCRCTDDKCDPRGACADQYTCQGGWFGPACQYADMAYNTSNISGLTDGKDDTCADNTGLARLLISLKGSIIFTWLRVHVTDKVTSTLRNLQMTLSHNKSDVKCPDLKTHAVDSRTLDMHCISEDEISNITLIGDAVSSLCSVYVSGGRNVALKEKAEQGDTYLRYWPWLAVDGDTRQDFTSGTCIHTDYALNWGLHLSKQRSVHRYVIYNRVDDGLHRLIGFKLESYDQLNKSVFTYKDANTRGLRNYRIIHTPRSIQTLSLTCNNSDKVLNFCEFEVYGDSICDNNRFGFECEQSCNCHNGESCFVNTGGCLSGCPAGFSGGDCQTSCKVGMFGEHCNMTCSENCQPTGYPNLTPCNVSTGECLKRCQPGFTGSECLDSCKVGMFGEHCNTTCSEYCKPTGDPNLTPCNASTGECLKGCQPGFSGNRCFDKCADGSFGAYCNSSCSKNCLSTDVKDLSPCDPATGNCRKGCNDGFSGSSCLEECPAGKYGENCNSSCNQNCMASDVKDMSPCNHVTGRCSKGCTEGFYGSFCIENSVATTHGSHRTLIIVGLCLLIFLIVCIGYFLCKKRSALPGEENSISSSTV